MGNIRPYGRPKGRNYVGIYLFETIRLQVESWENLGKPAGDITTLLPWRTTQLATPPSE